MVLDEGKQDRRSAQGHTSRPRRPPRQGIFVPLFPGASNRDPPDRERERQQEREREQRDRVRDDRDRNRDSHHHHHHHQHSRHQPRWRRSTPPPPTPPPQRQRVAIKIKSLDDHKEMACEIRLGCSIMKLEQTIRQQYEQRYRTLNPTNVFRFFSPDGNEFRQSNTIDMDYQCIWYRVSRFAGEVEEWKLTRWGNDTHGRLAPSLTRQLVQEIDAGATVGQLRRRIAEHLNIEDPYRVVLIARGGMRPGSLKGECWEIRQVKNNWLCHWISIDVYPENRYVILKGLRRDYVIHPDQSYFRGMKISEVKSTVELKLFRSVYRGYKSNFILDPRLISLSRKGRSVGDGELLRWCEEYTFELPDDAAEVFSDEETWLLPTTETCMICIEDKKVTELPVRITTGCKHQATTCKDCVKQWLESSLDSGTWDRLKCPECPELLKYHDVKRYASDDIFTRYDTLATRTALKDMPGFRWCLSATCGSGQIVAEDCPKFKCKNKKCKASHCTNHNIPWHENETCEEYDRRNRKRQKEEKASEDMIKKTSKKCPECKKDVHKYTGCNHITCVCGHEWCYICFAKFERNHVGFLFCRHNPNCTERDPFIDLIDNPPNANGQQPNGFIRPRPRAMFAPGVFPPPLRARQPGQAGFGRAPMRFPAPVPPPPPAPPGWGGPGLNGPQARPRQQPDQFGQPVLLPGLPGLFAGHVATAAEALQNGLHIINGMNEGPRNNGHVMMQNLRQTARTLDELRRMQM